ncbi:sensor histidine kinase [Parenemella sanctibonifatiensis]|uniref:Sensor-like histidine kinase SenX3 n=1 Tax=Parenemella sanctibonifatiensis TaxID=2016505 RepID=A0A255ESW1_9ACTN|nr:ATP-binding protein [Parenemella sanctibonifatiensis]OYN92512.1 two-component sensor histidine kinase [Parenemella sanctibonifatiensis]
MDIVGWLALGALIGAAAVVAAGWLFRMVRNSHQQTDQPDTVLPPVAEEILASLRAGTLVLDERELVQRSSPRVRSLGLVRGRHVIAPQVQEAIRTARRESRLQQISVDVERGRGMPAVVLSVRVMPLRTGQVFVLVEDETAARRVDATRRDFLANISHELKTPIGALSLLAETVEEAADDPEAVRRFAGRMNIESARLSALVQQVIELSRLQADDPLMAADEVEVDEVLSEAVARSLIEAEAREVTISRAVDRGCLVIGDAEHLTVAVANLVQNAIRYSEPGARVAVASRMVDDDGEEFVEITVSDNGIGIDPADVDRIFERFYRVDYARSRANGGTGLGLSIVKHTIAAHGGTISVWSKPGQGSTFTIRIPALIEAGRRQEAV